MKRAGASRLQGAARLSARPRRLPAHTRAYAPPPQVRTCEVLSHCLRHYRRDKELAGRLVLPWRPLYEALRRHCADEGLPEMRGGLSVVCVAGGLFV